MKLKSNKAWAIYRKKDGDIVENIFETKKEAEVYFMMSLRNISRKLKASRKLVAHLRKGYKIVRIKISI